jgi:hypothetical protein
MSSEAIGGLYVAVGVDADPAISKIKQVSAAVIDAYSAINNSGKAISSLDKLAKQYEKVAVAAERAAKATQGIKSGATSGASAAPRPVTPRVPARSAASEAAAANRAILKEQERLYAQLQKQREMDNKALIDSVIKSAKARQAAEIAAERQIAAQAKAVQAQRVQMARLTQADINRAHADALRFQQQMDRERVAAAQAAERMITQAHADAIRMNQQLDRDRANTARAVEQEINKAHADALKIQSQMDRAKTEEFKRLKREEAEAAKRAAKEEADAKKRSQSLLRAGSSTIQQAATGYGAARSGNIGYAIAAGVRGVRNMNTELGAIPFAAKGAALGVAAIGVAAIAAAAGVVALGKKIADIGFQGAADLQMLEIQFTGLLGSAARAKEETDFLIELGKESIIPTQALMDADRQLLAFGIRADDTRRRLVEFSSDFGTATGKTAEQIYYLNLALGQVAAIGKANTIDLRQLANVGVSTADVYGIIGEKIGKSAKFVAENVKEGIITAPMLFAALDEYGNKFKDTADEAKLSTKGLIANIKDQIEFGLGEAFLGANSMVAKSLSKVMELTKKIDFSAIGKAFEKSMVYISAAFEGIDWDGVVKFFNTWFPRAIKVTAVAINGLIRYWRILTGIVNYAMQIIRFTWEGIVQAFVGIASAASETLDWLGAITDEAGQANRDKLNQMWADTETMTADIYKEWAATSADINAVWSAGSIKQLFVEVVPYQGYDESQKLSMQRPTAPPVKKPFDWMSEFNKWKGKDGGKSKTGGGADKESPAEVAAKAAIERMKDLIDKASAASEQLATALIVPFRKFIEANGGTVQSAVEQSFSSMDYTSITTQFTELRDALKDFYAPFEDPSMAGSKKVAKRFREERRAQVTALEADVRELLRVAASREVAQRKFEDYEKAYTLRMEALGKQKEALTKQYDTQKAAFARKYDDYYTATSMTEGKFVRGALSLANEALEAAKQKYDDAKAKLEELVAARNSFLEGVANSLRGYVNQLSMVTQEIQKYTRLDEAGSFSLTNEKKNDLSAWKAQLQERLDALKKYRQQVAQLSQAGLDSDLLQSIVAAGPDSTAALINELAGATRQDLADINAVQAELKSTISGFQTEVSAKWFDQGIAAQEAIVTPLKAALDSAQANVDALTKEKEMALGILEAWYADQNAAIAAQEAKEVAAYETEKANLEKFLMDTEKASKETAEKIQKSFSWLTDPKNKKNTMQAGIAAMQGFIDGMDSQEKQVVETAKRIANAAAAAIRNALQIKSPSRVMMALGEYTTEGFVLGMQNGMDGVESVSALTLGALSSSVAAGDSLTTSSGTTEVKVFIGDRELTDIVDVQINTAARTDRDLVIAGRRY